LKLEKVKKLHEDVVHSPRPRKESKELKALRDAEYLEEDRVISNCGENLLTLICSKCFKVVPLTIEDAAEEPALMDKILAKHHLVWKTRPYRIETRAGEVVIRGPKFVLDGAEIKRALRAFRQKQRRAAKNPAV
jgi:hypothetical protein